MAKWQLQEAKQKLSAVVDRALARRGCRPSPATGSTTAVVLSVDRVPSSCARRSRNRLRQRAARKRRPRSAASRISPICCRPRHLESRGRPSTSMIREATRRFLADTNLLSEPLRKRPSPAVMAWLAVRSDGEIAASIVSIGEMLRGAFLLETRDPAPDGQDPGVDRRSGSGERNPAGRTGGDRGLREDPGHRIPGVPHRRTRSLQRRQWPMGWWSPPETSSTSKRWACLCLIPGRLAP